MGKLVEPTVYLIGEQAIITSGMEEYLCDSGNQDFIKSIESARKEGLSDGEILCSFYAKVCYASLTLGKNANVSRVRDIPDNLKGCFDQGHGSIFEHCQLNFIVRNCSRVFTHEIIRHRAGADFDEADLPSLRQFELEAAFSQTSGRYVRGDSVDIVFDPILEPVRGHITKAQKFVEDVYREAIAHMHLDEMKDFARKKKITSALRRILFNGQANEIGFSCNLRTLRHVVQLRTSRHAEWEIRNVFAQVYCLVKRRYPLIFYGAKEEIVDGLVEVSNMKMQPYEKEAI